MKITDQQRSMIASAFIAAWDAPWPQSKQWSLCCGPDADQACVAIVGKRKADKLREFFYDGLACAGFPEYPEQHEHMGQHHLDKIAELEAL